MDSVAGKIKLTVDPGESWAVKKWKCGDGRRAAASVSQPQGGAASCVSCEEGDAKVADVAPTTCEMSVTSDVSVTAWLAWSSHSSAGGRDLVGRDARS